MSKDFSRIELAPASIAPAPVAPAAVQPFGVLPAPMAAFPPGMPVTIAPVRRVVHPTRIIERHTVTRYPIVHVFPTHIRNVHHNIFEHYCEYPCSENQHVCEETRDHCCRPPVERP